MDEGTSLDNTKRQTINPLMDEINRVSEPLLKAAMKEFGYELPLAFRLYNQIRFYEEYGKLRLGTSIASKETLAQQFGVTVKQIDDAFHNLGSKYKLGKWVNHSTPVQRNITRTWMSNVRLNKGFAEDENRYSVTPEPLQRNSKSVTAYQLAPEVRPLSESKRKVSETILVSKDTKVETQKVYDLFITSFNKNPNLYKLTPKRRQKIKTRLNDAGLDMLTKAITNVANDPFYCGDNDRGWVADLDFIIRSYEQVERLATLNDNKERHVYDW